MALIPLDKDQDNHKEPESEQMTCMDKKHEPLTKLRVYSRRPKSTTASLPTPDHLIPICELTDNIHASKSDLELPNALRKGVKSCCKYPISNFVSLDHFSSSYCACGSQLSSMFVPKNFQDALKDPKWKKAMGEEMNALKK